jgi:hypothetical protein
MEDSGTKLKMASCWESMPVQYLHMMREFLKGMSKSEATSGVWT